jgi:hypothetical protein
MNQTIKTFLLEALGVPQGIIDASEQLFKKILSNVNRLDDIEDDFRFEVSSPLTISDFRIKKLVITLGFVETDQVESVRYYSMAFHHQSKYDDDSMSIISKPYDGIVKLSIGIAYPENSTAEDVKKYFKENATSLVTSLAHELKHSFDDFKDQRTSVKNISKYLGIQKTNFPFKPISNFLFNLYFIHSIENLVRPTEFATLMKLNNVNKKDFYKFVTSSEMYGNLKNAYNFSYEKMTEELKKDIPNIKSFLDRLGVDVPNTDDEIVDELLRLLYVNLVNNTISTVKELMTNNFLENLFGFSGDKDKFFDKLARIFSKFSDRELDFFKYEEKNMKHVSSKMMKKISKLYDLANDDKSSIKDWELHQKISGKTNETIDKDYKYKIR